MCTRMLYEYTYTHTNTYLYKIYVCIYVYIQVYHSEFTPLEYTVPHRNDRCYAKVLAYVEINTYIYIYISSAYTDPCIYRLIYY
jgi:hypothetical protein